MSAMDDRSDERRIVLRVQAGDRQAFGELVERNMKRAYYSAVGLTGSHEDGLELSQEAFARAFRARASIDADRPFYTWYYQILRRLCFNLARDTATRRDRFEAQTPWLVMEAENRAPGNPESELWSQQLRVHTQGAIEKLPDAEREIIVLRELQDMSYREIAGLLEIPVGTVMSRLYTARSKLAKALADVL